MTTPKLKVALVVSHPIQHFCPQYVSFAQNPGIDFHVFFASSLGAKAYMDKNFGEVINWGNLNLDAFPHTFLSSEALPSGADLDAENLEQALDAYQPDLIISYGYFQKLQRRAHKYATSRNIKLVYISDAEKRQQRAWYKTVLKWIFLNRYFSKVQHFLTVGDANEEFYRFHGVPAKKFIRMHFPIDIALYQKEFANHEALRTSIREQYAIPANELVFCVVGKLVSWKNQDHLISLLKLLENRGIQATLLLVGSGEMMEAWKKTAEQLTTNRVVFTGFVKIENLPAYYAASDLYIHPAAVEPHSIAVSEAIYMGLPVIVSDRSGSYGPTDDVQIGKNGFIYPFGDLEHLADLVTRFQDERLREQFSDHSHHISEKFQQRSHFGAL
ncbi:MAG: glycosyltransferase family 4 protein, partial [Bacteroidota bacterium]